MGTITDSEYLDEMPHSTPFHRDLHCLSKKDLQTKNSIFFEIITLHPRLCKMDYSKFMVSNETEESISIQRVKQIVWILFLSI